MRFGACRKAIVHHLLADMHACRVRPFGFVSSPLHLLLNFSPFPNPHTPTTGRKPDKTMIPNAAIASKYATKMVAVRTFCVWVC
jgi:hypothetical protein